MAYERVRRHSPYLIKLVLLFLTYFVTAKCGLAINALNNFATLVWPPAGIALAALLIYGLNLWPGIFLGAALVNYLTGAPLLAALGIATGNTLEAVIGAYLCTLAPVGFHNQLDRRTDVSRLVLRAAFFSTLISATVGPLCLWISGTIATGAFFPTAFQWWVGDVTGDLTVAPLLLVLCSPLAAEALSWKKYGLFERIFFSSILLISSVGILSGAFGAELTTAIGMRGVYVLIPILLWASMRYGQRGSAVAGCITVAAATWATATGRGVFTGFDTRVNLTHLLVFVTVIVITNLFVGAIVTEKEQEKLRLERSKALIESQAQQLRLREFELQQAKEDAVAANAAKSTFLTNMSHEIRTPLGGILGFSELLADDHVEPGEKQHIVEAIKRNGKLLLNIINDVLDLSKIEAGKLEVELTRISFEDLLSDISAALNLAAVEKGIAFKISCVGPVPAMIVTDSIRLRQILLNVVGNAIKFTSQGSVDVQVKYQHTGEHSSKLVFKVIDTGKGIPAEQVDRLFKPFTQADASTTRLYGGSGLGLALSRKLARALGGDVELIASAPEVGSTFVITVSSGSPEDTRPIDLNLVANKVSPPVPRLDGLNVLLVEDSIDNQVLIEKILRSAGAKVVTANNGSEGIEKASSGQFHAILMDLQMPIIDGYKATKKLRDQGFDKPIIALTAHAMREERERCLRSGFSNHLSKPVDRHQLYQILASARVNLP